MSACPLVVLACESLHVCTVCIWRCEHARFCVEGFYALYINFHSFIHSSVHDTPAVEREVGVGGARQIEKRQEQKFIIVLSRKKVVNNTEDCYFNAVTSPIS